MLVRLVGWPVPAQKGLRPSEYLTEVDVVQAIRAPREAGVDQSHGERVAGEHHYSPRVVVDEICQASANLHRGVPVVGEREYATGVLAPCAYQVCDTMHQHPRLAGAGPGKHEHVGLLPIVRHDSPLDGILKALDDGPP